MELALSPQRKILGSQENYFTQRCQNNNTSTDQSCNDITSSNHPPLKPPRSAFMCFSDAKQAEILKNNKNITENADVLRIVAEEWRKLSDHDRAFWDEEARNDKVRFVREKAECNGTWAVPKRRAKKHPLAPKRPMSAFLKYSKTRRAKVKADNPDISNTDVSRLLGEMWRNASKSEKAPYVEDEKRERSAYKEKIRKFREEQSKLDNANRRSHHVINDSMPLQEIAQTSELYHSQSIDNALQKADQRTYRHYHNPPPPPMVEIKHATRPNYRPFEQSYVDYGRHPDPRVYRTYPDHANEEPIPHFASRAPKKYNAHQYVLPYRPPSRGDDISRNTSREDSPEFMEPIAFQPHRSRTSYFEVESPVQRENDYLYYQYT